MAILGVDDFKSKLVGGGARANLFKATINFPGYAGGDVELTSFMCKGAGLPASVIAPITIPFRGRQLQIAGDRIFEPWTITVINDTNFAVRNAMERWMNGINEHTANTGLVNPVDYQADMIVEQLNKAGDSVKRYDLRGLFPTNISQIELSFDAENQIEEFQVEFQVQYWESGTTT
ncbi:MAG: hypothetical protein CMH04_00890 [Marinovum sp.]|nr:hypothetical protein [Marinovum sp.]|tara:strand:+ start:375 stop:902 length:528 start_codon:yes stop_codon:yes gene_type:complete